MAVYYSENAVSPGSDVHGSMKQVANAVATTINTINVWEQVVNFSEGLTDNFTFASSALTCGLDGDYEINWNCAGVPIAANKVFEFSISVNDVIQAEFTVPRKFTTTTDSGSMAATAFLTLSVGDVVKFEIRNTTDATNFLVQYANVMVHQLQ